MCLCSLSVLCLKVQDLFVIKAIHSSYRGFLNSSCSGTHLSRVFPVDVVGGLSSAAHCLLTRSWGSALNSRVTRA